jgi:hypothetical protein
MLIPFTIDSHLTTLPGVEDVTIMAAMVLRGVGGIQSMLKVVDSK